MEEAKRDYKQFFKKKKKNICLFYWFPVETKKIFLKNLIEKLRNIKLALHDSKVILKNNSNIIFLNQERNIESIQTFIANVSKLQEEIHLKMRNSLKILEHQNKQLEKESLFVQFISNFPNFYSECVKEQTRRNNFSNFSLKYIGNLMKNVNFEKEKRNRFFRETMMNEMEFCPRTFFPNLINEDDSMGFYLNTIKLNLEKQIIDQGKKTIIFCFKIILIDNSGKMENFDEVFLEKIFIETEYLCEMYIFFTNKYWFQGKLK